MAEITPTRGAAQALAEEKSFIETGFGFLDEKRVLLAATLMKELEAWRGLRDAYDLRMADARQALQAAIARHGLERMQIYPVPGAERAPLAIGRESFLGVGRLREPDLDWPAPEAGAGPDRSAEAEACRRAFAALIPLAARIAVRQVNIHKLIREYRSTERRAMALENVLLPETTALLAQVNEFLDEADQEEAVRIRNAGRAR